MEKNGTAILLDVKTLNGGDLILVVDHQDKIVSLVEVDKSTGLHVKEVHNYTKPGYVKAKK
jgi:hypothetical protein